MKLTPAKTPLMVKKMFPDYLWDITTNHKEIYLTFDDGPTPNVTDYALQFLKQYDAKATFFCIGDNVNKHRKLFCQIIDEGHSIGNHTYNHIKGWKTKTKDYLDNVLQAEEVFSLQSSVFSHNNQITNHKSQIVNHNSSIAKLFRPPYGQIKPKQGKKIMELGYKIIMWDVLSFDWDNTVSNQECLDHVLSKCKNGSIIVFHDSLKAANNMKFALPKVLEHFTEKGFSFKAIAF